MHSIVRRILLASSLLAGTIGVSSAAAQAPKPVPGRPYQFWDVLEADGAARKVYVRNDGTTPITIIELDILKCDNTRQKCGTYPANLVIAPGKTVVAFRAEQFDRKLGWSFSYTFRTQGTSTTMSGPPTGAILRPDGTTGPVLQSVPIDSLVPAVAASTGWPSCGKLMVPDLPPGHRALVMWFGTASQPHARTVRVRLDATGSPYDFSDVRRDPDDSSADPRSAQITIDFVRQTVMLRNSGGGQPVAVFRASGPTLLTATSLGLPGETIGRMVKECDPGT